MNEEGIMRFILDFSVFVFIVFQSLPVFSGSGTHPFTVHDMLAMDRIAEPQVSQDGKWIVFTLRKTDLDANRGRTDLWLVGAGGAGLRQLTSHPDGDYSPRWLPGGREILFLSTRSGSSQIWKIRMDGGEADQITRLPLDVGNFIISPCGEWLAVTMDVFPGMSPDDTAKKLKEIEGRTATGMLYDRIFVRHWDTWMDG